MNSSTETYKTFWNTIKDVFFIIGDWNAKVGSQELPTVTEKFDPGVQKETGQRLTALSREHTGHSEHNT